MWEGERERENEGRHRVHSRFRKQRTLQTGVESGTIKCFSGKMRSRRRRRRRRTGRLVSPLLEVGGGTDGRAGDTRVTRGLRHPSARSLPPPVSFSGSGGKLPGGRGLTDVDDFNRPCPDCMAHLPGKHAEPHVHHVLLGVDFGLGLSHRRPSVRAAAGIKVTSHMHCSEYQEFHEKQCNGMWQNW